MASPQASSGTKGIGPHFSTDAQALTLIYQNHGMTHDEYRANLARLGLDQGDWPEGWPKPIMFGIWPGMADNPDDPETPDQIVILEPPPPLPDEQPAGAVNGKET